MYGEIWYSGTTVPDMAEDFLQAILSLCNNLGEKDGEVWGGRIENIRSNSVYSIDNADFKTLILGWVQKANEEKGWNFDIDGLENLQLSKYKEGEKYSWHMDIRPSDPMRKLTFNVLLNSDFEGGDFQFSWGTPSAPYKKRVKAAPQLKIPGRMGVFPSYYYHRITPVTSGTRYSLQGWATGPPFK